MSLPDRPRKMEKILVIGPAGSGKSTFAERLAATLSIPIVHLDSLRFASDGSYVDDQAFEEKLNDALALPRFVIDGNYPSSLPLRLAHADTVFFLDTPLSLCRQNLEKRSNRPDRYGAPALPKEQIDFLLSRYEKQGRDNIIAALSEFRGDAYLFRAYGEAEEYLSALGQSVG